jgi:hypothetical protein
MKILVTKKPQLYIYNANVKNYTIFHKEIKKGEIVRFYLRIYNKGEHAKFIKIKTLDSVPQTIDSNYLDSL